MNRMLQSSFFLDYAQSRMLLACPEDDLAVSERTTRRLAGAFSGVVDAAVSALAAASAEEASIATVCALAPTPAETVDKQAKKAKRGRPADAVAASAPGGDISVDTGASGLM